MIQEWAYSLIAGLFVGIIFKLINLPAPAPPVFSGILGITGIYLGAIIVSIISKIEF